MEQSLFVVVVSARDDDAVGIRVDRQTFECRVDGIDDQPLRAGEAFAVAVLVAIVDDPDIEADIAGQLGNLAPDVARSHDHQPAAFEIRQVGRARFDVRSRPLGEGLEVREELGWWLRAAGRGVWVRGRSGPLASALRGER